MTDQPFTILRGFSNAMHCAFFDKSDDPIDDQAIANALGGRDYASLHQVHGSRVIIARSPIRREEKADGMITDQPGLVLTIRVADCQAFLIAAPEKCVMGVLHAGWRGLVSNAISEFYAVLRKEWKIGPEETFVGAAPSLCMRCAEFTDPTKELPGIPRELIQGRNADLRAWADDQFETLGVPKKNRERMEGCTRCSPEKFWTYRGGDRESVIAGKTNVLACVMSDG